MNHSLIFIVIHFHLGAINIYHTHKCFLKIPNAYYENLQAY